MIKLIEACLESLPQFTILLGLVAASRKEIKAFSITENVDTSSGMTFFAFNILFSFLTLVNSIVGSVNIMKGHQLNVKQKCVLGVSYVLQILSRVIPIFLVILLTIEKKMKMEILILVLVVPIPIHWLLQFLIC